MNMAERLWNLRDGILAWLYELRVGGSTIAEALPEPFMTATSWSGTEVTREELNSELEWLMEEGYVDGTGTMQRIVLRPQLTPYGEKYAASGKSVRDLPGVAEVQNPYLHIEGSSGVAIAFHSWAPPRLSTSSRRLSRRAPSPRRSNRPCPRSPMSRSVPTRRSWCRRSAVNRTRIPRPRVGSRRWPPWR